MFKIFDFGPRRRLAGQLLVAAFFLFTALSTLPAGDTAINHMRAFVASLVFLLLAVLAVPQLRERILDRLGKNYTPGELVTIYIVLMLLGIGISPPT